MIPGEFTFELSVPAGTLARDVEGVWYARGATPHGRERILPSPGAVLLLILGPPLRMTEPLPDAAPRELGGAWISGPHERPILNEPTGETHVVGVVFRPGGIAAFLSGSAELLANRILPLGDVPTPFGNGAALVTAIRGGADVGACLQAVTERLADAVAPPDDASVWRRAIENLVAEESESIQQVQTSLGASRRHFVAEVRRRSGLPPKALQRIARLRRLLQALDARKPIRWSHEAVGAGYFDQPHAIREFRAFTGMTPTEYVRRRQEAWGHDVEPGEAVNFVPELIR